MAMTVDTARDLARTLVGEMGRRWEHVQAVGQRAEELGDCCDLPEHVIVAAWLHDVGYAPPLVSTHLHALDGAQFLSQEGAPDEVVRLVGWHTGAQFEADERGLVAEWSIIPEPQLVGLDALTMIDLSTGPDGAPMVDTARLAEILRRYSEDDPVHRAVERSAPALLAASRRAKDRLGLPQDWPICS
ncbi:metal dependent phosphohydrolase [Austwickia chelonae]|uniref:HD domain-containing protein n=1 Tax=Austwickia chelonae NBRC 105200 TaxID=1184607 RepID=K6VR65_9MICO|nr:HD domain-containing protein [Austwickia chelonae]GAB77855.1 hypothetical protein AUCHE_08_00970 [Austwickia chelonae NBRC 105200]SEV90868.1 metal dependent phosphohydrolase [Austwickia chelonae]